jgi:hypothetical protein
MLDFVLAGANNLIPMEIALKIAEKIKANERFAVYIVIPMWPEGVPTGAATQRILFWQVWFKLKSQYECKKLGKDFFELSNCLAFGIGIVHSDIKLHIKLYRCHVRSFSYFILHFFLLLSCFTEKVSYLGSKISL